MKPAPFVHHAPTTIEETVALMADDTMGESRIIAGGQSVVPAMAFRLAQPDNLIDINNVTGLDRLSSEDGVLMIGANVRHAAFQEPVQPGPLGELLSVVVRNIAHYPIRTRGPVCGGLANADTASEWCLVAATLDAEIQAISTEGARSIPINGYFVGAMTTALRPDELLAEARIPLLTDDTNFGFYEFSRRAGDFAMGMALTAYRVEQGVIVDPRVGIGGIEETPRRVAEVEAALVGRPACDEVFRIAAGEAAAVVDPIEDHQTSADYRRDLAGTVIRRALEETIV